MSRRLCRRPLARTAWKVVLPVVLFAAAGPAHAQTDIAWQPAKDKPAITIVNGGAPLSLAECIHLALERQPRIAAQRASLAAAEDGSRALEGLKFAALIDPIILQKCIPGCEQMEKTGDNRYNARLTAGVGPVKGVFTATVALEEITSPEHYKLVVEGKGQPGFVKGSGSVTNGTSRAPGSRATSHSNRSRTSISWSASPPASRACSSRGVISTTATLQPPAIAGTTMISSPSRTLAAKPPLKRASSSFR